MYVSRESIEQTDRRLRHVAAQTNVEVLEGEWWFEEFPLDRLADRTRPDALALVRDGDGWSQLVPIGADDRPIERFRVWCCHFPSDLDNSGFVGWLATRIKRKTGSGIFVVCGQNSARGGIYDYAGCPADVADAVLAEVSALTAGSLAARPRSLPVQLDGLQLRAVATAAGGEISRDTLFTFTQDGNVVSAQYAGGSVRLGHLVGTIAEGELKFRYAQVSQEGRVDGGTSICHINLLPDGRIQLHEQFEWESRAGSGINVLEEIEA